MALASSISAVTGASPLFLKPILFTHKTLLYTSLNDSRRNLSFSLTGRRRKFTGEESSRRKVRSSPHRSSSTHCVHVVGRDLQSYLSDLSLFLAPESKTFYILVDNRPWLEDLVSGPAHLWQLMVTKSRLSPFAITRGQKEEEEEEIKQDPQRSKPSRQLRRWLSMATQTRKRVLLPVKKLRTSLLANSKLHRTLYGFIVFQVAWKDVRGINYLNQLQTDTSLAIEAKYMRRWEFDSIAQAANGITSWFLGTPYERLLLEHHLNSMIGEAFHEAGMDTPSTCGSSSDDDKVLNNGVLSEHESPCSSSSSSSSQSEEALEETNIQNTKLINSSDVENDTSSSGSIPSPCPSECVEATQYRDVLLLFRFNDADLPFKLQKIIMLDLRLLTLLEAGLPSWVIFFQSYPVFCHVYRPWMCPLARTLYVAISFVTVLIGFYDLYKNIPVLKATASRLFGPLFDWIETWEMVSRIKYLGTMLFLHNAEKAVMWFLMVTRAFKSLVSFLTQPLVAPFMVVVDGLFPFWNVFMQMGERLHSFICMLVGTSWNLVDNCVDTLLLPVWYISSVICNFATGVMSPILLCLWRAVCAPIQVVLGLSKFLGYIYKYIYESLGGIWLFVSPILKVASKAEVAATHTYEVSMWRALWNDLFSKLFRAIKSILYGVVAFFAACNRHRLSIYNHVREFIQRLHQPAQTPPPEPKELRSLPTKSTKQS
ncbi:uncharacterized protein LOC110886279 isoform X2 [Helianthus annuus]|uniref:uncharacterized protein LOC110886279 isoform X2 n=1 Tax=Helianthus annuus TaxID=4232 RepID=UPI000B8FBB77|nr:uncharacterized protein LOC110886279 isoform X2 [Helianthus annuus]